jgi:hypothetical protein
VAGATGADDIGTHQLNRLGAEVGKDEDGYTAAKGVIRT